MQGQEDLDDFYKESDPWGYFSNPDDKTRLEAILETIPRRKYASTLDIGCGNGFVTVGLPGSKVMGIDLSSNAVIHAEKYAKSVGSIAQFEQLDVFDVDNRYKNEQFDLVVITGVLYDNYIGKAKSLIALKLDNILAPNGIIMLVHIREWLKFAPPYSLIDRQIYNYRSYEHLLEVYQK